MGKFAQGKFALGICDRCGFSYKLKKLRGEYTNDRLNGLLVCKTCFDLQHPQDDQGKYPVFDAEALENPRPDTDPGR